MQPYVVSQPVVSVPVKKQPSMKLPEKTIKRIRKINAEDQRRKAQAMERQLARLKKQVVSGR